LAGWFARSSRDVCVVPDGFSRAGQERDCNLAPKKLCSSELIATKLIGAYKAC
jgi:hypothetical protein